MLIPPGGGGGLVQHQFCMFDENQMTGPAGEGKQQEACGVSGRRRWAGGGTASWWGVQRGQGPTKRLASKADSPMGCPGSRAAPTLHSKWDQPSLEWVEGQLSSTLAPSASG